MFGNHSKLVAAIAGNIVGNLVAIALAYMATKFPALTKCTEVSAVLECTALGYTQHEIAIGLIAIFNTSFVYFFPANKPKT